MFLDPLRAGNTITVGGAGRGEAGAGAALYAHKERAFITGAETAARRKALERATATRSCRTTRLGCVREHNAGRYAGTGARPHAIYVRISGLKTSRVHNIKFIISDIYTAGTTG